MSEALPDLHRRWAASLLDAPLAPETKATCASCAMCARPGALPPGARPFLPEVKCCTYVAELPNFLVGRILADDDPAMAAGRATVEARIAAGPGVTPLGLYATAEDGARFRAAGDYQGHRADLRCPHFLPETGACGIWKHRNGACSTWFCKHDRGAAGQAAWDALRELFRTAEAALAVWCAEQLELDASTLGLLLGGGSERGPVPSTAAERARYWGGWFGRERELYLASARRVAGLGWEDILAIGGVTLAARARVARAAVDRLGADVPERLRLAPWTTLATGADATLVTTYSPHDPLLLPAPLFSVLHYFDGRPVADALAAMRDERGVALEEELVRTLVDFRLLGGAPG